MDFFQGVVLLCMVALLLEHSVGGTIEAIIFGVVCACVALAIRGEK